MNRSLFFAGNLLLFFSLCFQVDICVGAESWPLDKSLGNCPIAERAKIKKLYLARGINGEVSTHLYQNLKSSAHLSDSQFDALLKWGKLDNRLISLGAHNYSEEHISPVAIKHFNMCVDISRTLSDEQLEEYCQWKDEQLMIESFLWRIARKDKFTNGNDEYVINSTTDKILNSKSYKSYRTKKEHSANQGINWGSYFYKRKKAIKLRVEYKWLLKKTNYAKPPERRNLNTRIKTVLAELSAEK